MAKFLTLWLEAPLQSWGFDSRFDARRTLDFPTKSGIYGLLLAASGEFGAQESLLAKLAECRLTVYTFQDSGSSLTDFHMVGNGYDSKDPWQKMMTPKKSDGSTPVGGGAKLTYRDYLQDRKFAAILEMSDGLADKYAQALQNPVYDLYLGRKCCVPTDLIYRGCFFTENDAVSCLQKLAEQKDCHPKSQIKEIESPNDPEAIILPDVPVRFGIHKSYRERIVKKETFSFSQS